MKELYESYKYPYIYFDFTMNKEQHLRLISITKEAKSYFEESTVVISLVQFDKNINKINKEISDNWTEFITGYNQEINENFSILCQIREDKRIIAELNRKISACTKWSLHEEKCVAYKSSRKTADELFKDIKLDDEIVDFLKKVGDKKATLNDLTPTILEWIKAENMTGKNFLSTKIQ